MRQHLSAIGATLAQHALPAAPMPASCLPARPAIDARQSASLDRPRQPGRSILGSHFAKHARPTGDTMTTDLTPSRQKLAARDRSLPLKVTGRLKVAIEAMVWQAASRKDAAAIAGMTDHSLRQALRRSHVMHHYLRECEVLRQSGKAKRPIAILPTPATTVEPRRDAVAAAPAIASRSLSAVKSGEPSTPPYARGKIGLVELAGAAGTNLFLKQPGAGNFSVLRKFLASECGAGRALGSHYRADRSAAFMGNSHPLSKKLHSLPSSIRRIIQPRGHSCAGAQARRLARG
jgi:hypothetical protein